MEKRIVGTISLDLTISDVAESETPGSSVMVSGAGTAAVNGLYTPRGVVQGKTYYTLEGFADSDVSRSIAWDEVSVRWVITAANTDPMYFAMEDVEFPWNVTQRFEVDSGDEPAPAVSQS